MSIFIYKALKIPVPVVWPACCDGPKPEKIVSDNRTSTTQESILETNVGNEGTLEYVGYSQLSSRH